MEKINETFNPVYNNIEQVKKCAAFMLGEEVVEAHIAIVIGHNGRNFISSTDWRLVTKSGNRRILPFSMRPQYPNFVEVVAGTKYEVTEEGFRILPDAPTLKKSAKIVVGSSEFTFKPGEALKIYAQPNDKFIATDCPVTVEENEKMRTYTIHVDSQVIFGFLNEKGSISQA